MILNLQAVTVPDEPTDLIQLVNDALIEPDLLSKERSDLQALYCPFYDGKAGTRIANIIINAAEN